MHNKIKQYFSSLENETVQKELFTYINQGGFKKINDYVNRYVIGDLGYFMKKNYDTQSIASAAVAKMYQQSGILTPQIYFIKEKHKNPAITIQQDATTINNIVSVLANDVVEYSIIDNQVFGKNKWDIFYDEELSQAFLTFMTPYCFESLQNLNLNDEIRTDNDRHRKNYLLYKSPDSKKYEGVIAIDLDNMKIYHYYENYNQDFKNFLYIPYSSETPQGNNDYLCYLQRNRNIRELIQDGVLRKNNIESLKKSLSFDLPKEINKNCKENNIRGKNKKNIVEPIKKLWEYNNKTIGKDLGL